MDRFKLKKITALFQKDKTIQVAYLFGSHAKGNFGPLSDYDFAVFLDSSRKMDFLKKQIYFTQLISSILGTSQVDILILNEASYRIAFQVLKYGKLLYQKSNCIRADFERTILNFYLDYKHFYNVADSYLMKRLKNKTFGERDPKWLTKK